MHQSVPSFVVGGTMAKRAKKTTAKRQRDLTPSRAKDVRAGAPMISNVMKTKHETVKNT
jgi:hypothetical protein